MANPSALILLNYPNAGPFVLVMVLLAMFATMAAALMLCIILKYDSFANRHTSLLTRTYNMTEWVRLLWLPIIVFDFVIIITGWSFHPSICYGYALLDFTLENAYLATTAMEAVVHYFFVVKLSSFLIIRDDLLCTIFWRMAVAISVVITGKFFMDLKQMPMSVKTLLSCFYRKFTSIHHEYKKFQKFRL